MAGFNKIYCLGGVGGFAGADGLNPIFAQFWVGHADRMWLEAKYFVKDLSPMGSISRIVPETPDSPFILVDACLAFCPVLFDECPSLKAVYEKLANAYMIDFHLSEYIDISNNKFPMIKEWTNLRQEALPIVSDLNIYEGDLIPVLNRGNEND